MGAAARSGRQRFGEEALGLTISLGDGRDALPRDPRQDVRWLISGAAPLIVYAFRRVRRSTSTEAFQTCDAGRARVQLPSEAGTLDMTIGGADADRAGARPLPAPAAERLGPIIPRVAHSEQRPSCQWEREE
jgi:hypothetical protein